MELFEAFTEIAKKDLEAANLLKDNGFVPQAIFFAQQGAEKSAKAFLYKKGLGPIKSHYLPSIFKRNFPDEQALKDIVENLDFLDNFVNDTRYPLGNNQGYQSPADIYTIEDAKNAINRAVRVKEDLERLYGE